jgi:hypothetical protein
VDAASEATATPVHFIVASLSRASCHRVQLSLELAPAAVKLQVEASSLQDLLSLFGCDFSNPLV